LSSSNGLAYIYCNYKEQEKQTLTNLMASLVQQLVLHSSAVPDEVRALHAHHDARNTRPGDADYSKILRPIVAIFSRVYVVVDALDECNESNGTRTKLSEELKALPANVQLLCTSRRLGDIEKSFALASHLEIRARDADVEMFLNAQISQTPRLLEFCTSFKDLQSTIIEKLVEKAKGMSVSSKDP
jgi:hypothetical protein